MPFEYIEVPVQELDLEFGKNFLWKMYLLFIKNNARRANQNIIMMTKKEFQRLDETMKEVEKTKSLLDKLVKESAPPAKG